MQGPAGRDAFDDLCGLGEGQGGGLLDRRGGRGPDLAAGPEQGPAQPVTSAQSGIRATPMRQPPSARLLLSPVVTTVCRGATWAGLRTGAASSWIKSR